MTEQKVRHVGQASERHEAQGQSPRHHGTLHMGSYGDAVQALQGHLAQLGYKDAHGDALALDAYFGWGTRVAVEAFQKDLGLVVDGKAAASTLVAIDEACARLSAPAARLDDPQHPDAALYRQAQSAVGRLDAEKGRVSDQLSSNLAAALTVAARQEGLTSIDQVSLSKDATKAIATQNRVGDFLPRSASLPTVEAVHTPIERSSLRWLQLPGRASSDNHSVHPD